MEIFKVFNVAMKATLKKLAHIECELPSFCIMGKFVQRWNELRNVQKAKILQVLGPIASDPLMVNAQIQQVQVLRDEPVPNKSQESRHAILDINSPADKKIREQMGSFHVHYEDLISWINEMQSRFSQFRILSVNVDKLQEELDELIELGEEVADHQKRVDEVADAGQDLMKHAPGDDGMRMKEKLDTLSIKFTDLTSRAADKLRQSLNSLSLVQNYLLAHEEITAWMDVAERQLKNLENVGLSSQGTIIQDFKQEMVEIESLNRQAQELMERTSPAQVNSIREPLAQINKRWEDLLKGIAIRQRELENALLRSDQFQHALDEFMAWMSKTEKTLDDLAPVFGDPQVIEVELAKHKVLMNDIEAHQTSVDTLNSAARRFIEANRGSEDARVTRSKLNKLNKRWQLLQLEEALHEAQIFNQEIQDLLMWLSDIDSQLASSKPVGGLSETAREQLNRFMELYNDLDSNKHKIDSVLQQGQDYLKRSNEGAAGNLQHNLKTLKQRWDNVLNRANDRKINLETALREATKFREALQDFVEWLTHAEKLLSNLKPVSRVMDVVLEQIEDHKALQKKVSAHREVMLNLEKKGNHLKYFSQKQDVILIKNLLISVQHRWERVVSKAEERTRALDHGYKEAKEISIDGMSKRQPDVDRMTKAFQSKRQPPAQQQQPHTGEDKGQERHESTKSGRGTPSIPKAPSRQGFEPEIKNPRARETVDRWRNVWLLAMERQKRLQDKLNYLKELERIKNFDFDEWRKRFLAWMNDKKSRAMDLFRKIDRDNDGGGTHEEVIDGILKSKFPTSRLEMERVAEIYDSNGDSFIDHKEYIDREPQPGEATVGPRVDRPPQQSGERQERTQTRKGAMEVKRKISSAPPPPCK